MRSKTGTPFRQKIKQVFSFLNVKKQILNNDDLRVCRATQFLVKFFFLLFFVCGCMMLIGGIFCIATFKIDYATSIVLIVFGIILTILGIGLWLMLNNIKARIEYFKTDQAIGEQHEF
jgi:hypothetical protein